MLKNKKGFTLIEILAAITILGILMTIAIVSVTKIIENGKKKHYTTAEANMVLAGQSFAQQNRSQLPKAIGQKKKIPMTMLVEKNYIQPVMDYSDNECNMAESYVQVFKYSQTDYSYLSYLKCPNYDSEENINELTPDIDAKIIHDEDKNTADAEIEITGNDKLMSYSYVIYRNNKEVKNTGSVEVKNFAESKSIKFSLEDYTPGNVKIVVTATNTYGNTKTKTVTKDIPDTKKPECVYINAEDEPDHPKTWINEGSRKITIGCDDGETGSGCTRETYTKTFKESMRTGTIRIEDEDGNFRNCEVSVYIDKVNPTITVKAYKKSSDDKKSGTVKKTVSTTTSNNSKTIDLSELNDTEWLNNADYPNGVYYELTLNDNLELATYKVTGNNTGLRKNASNVNTLSNSLANSTISGTSVTKSVLESTDGFRKTKAEITDAAGNKADIIMITPLDRVAPTVPTVSMYKWANNSTTPTSSAGLATYTNNTWSNKYVYTVASASEEGMSGFKEYKFTTTGRTTNESNAVGTTRNVKAEGESKIKYKACDVAGNCSSFSSEKTIKIDKTPPTCEVTGGSTSWINASSTTTKRTITATCVDNGSTCASDTAVLTKEYSDDIDTTTAGAAGVGQGGTVYDNAGNSVQCAADQTVRIDKTAPTVPTVSLYKWNGNAESNRPTSASGLSSYTANTWSNKKIYTVASGSTNDATSGFKEYQFTTTGTTTNEANKAQSSRSVEANGTSTIKYRACDNAGNCSGYSSTYTIKIDKIAPECSVSGGSTAWINASSNPGSRTITATCSDTGGSDCTTASATLSKTYSSNINTTTAGAVGDGSGGTVYDNAGNSAACAANQTVKIDKTAPTISDVVNSKKDTWTNGNVLITAKAADTGGSTLDASYYYYTSNDLKNDWDSDGTVSSIKGTWSAERNQEVFIITKDKAGNYSEAVSAGKVMIDKTAPTAPTSGAIGTVSGSSTAASIATGASGSTDTNGSGVSHYLYYVTNTSTEPAKTDSSFGTSTDFTRSCGKSYYGWAIAVDYAGNRSDVKGLGHTSDGANSYTYGSCSATCGTGTKTSTSNSCALITTPSTVECKIRDCCAETVTGSSCSDWQWSDCTKTCGGGTKYEYRTCNKVDAYDTSHSCTGEVTEKRSEGTACNTDSCCSESNPTSCNWVTSCRSGNTALYSSTAANDSVFVGTNTHPNKLYVLGTSGSLTKVYAPEGSFWGGDGSKIVWIYSNCLGPANEVCSYNKCPG